MYHAEASLIVEIAGEALDADVRAEDHVDEHAVISHRDALAGKIHSDRMLGHFQEITEKGHPFFASFSS